jgi:hypothetical protein
LSVRVSVPVCVPADEGSKNTLMVQLAPAARVALQPLVTPNWALACTLDMVNGASPSLVSVMFWGNPVVPTNCPGKVRLVGERLTPGPTPIPLRVTVCGLLAA